MVNQFCSNDSVTSKLCPDTGHARVLDPRLDCCWLEVKHSPYLDKTNLVTLNFQSQLTLFNFVHLSYLPAGATD